MPSYASASSAAFRVGRCFVDDQLMPVTVMPAMLADRLRAADLTYAEAGTTAGVLPVPCQNSRMAAELAFRAR